MKRRSFISNSVYGTLAAGIPYTNLSFLNNPINKEAGILTFGIIADIDHGMIPDTMSRLESFLENAIERDVDFIIQLGDFCHGESKSNDFLSL